MPPLSTIKEGQTKKVHKITCGHGVKHRLCSIGVLNGQELKVIKNDGHGPVVIKVMDSKLVIGCGQAAKIEVE